VGGGKTTPHPTSGGAGFGGRRERLSTPAGTMIEAQPPSQHLQTSPI
jgi:hypothetical protein